MVTTIKRERRFSQRPLQVRIPRGIEQRLQRMSKNTGVDRSTIARMALNSGLVALQKTLPREPAEEPQAR